MLSLDGATLFIVVFLGLFALLAFFGFRWARHSAPPSDLKRADDADRGDLPTPDEQVDRIMEVMDEMGPPGGPV